MKVLLKRQIIFGLDMEKLPLTALSFPLILLMFVKLFPILLIKMNLSDNILVDMGRLFIAFMAYPNGKQLKMPTGLKVN